MTDVAAEQRCVCCDLPVAFCGKAAEQRARAAARAEKPPHGAETTARYVGRCPFCSDGINVGERLRYDEEYGWVCIDCANGLSS